jgi:transcriptional regulator with XRE-family HTH domain
MSPQELLARRKALGMSQARLAIRLGVSVNTVARWERRELGIAHPEMVRLALEAMEREQRETAIEAGLGRSCPSPRP